MRHHEVEAGQEGSTATGRLLVLETPGLEGLLRPGSRGTGSNQTQS